jgi:hypothetical protein|tara:strand:- start:235 stop:495 length:261 start_codon:yes stop_codon:yes gene_type:complete
MIKAKYIYKDMTVGWVTFEMQPDYETVIRNKAPEKWDACVWDNNKVENTGKLKSIRKKISNKKKAKEIADGFEIDLNTNEDNGDLE